MSKAFAKILFDLYCNEGRQKPLLVYPVYKLYNISSFYLCHTLLCVAILLLDPNPVKFKLTKKIGTDPEIGVCLYISGLILARLNNFRYRYYCAVNGGNNKI
jgi:hypothetical protein